MAVETMASEAFKESNSASKSRSSAASTAVFCLFLLGLVWPDIPRNMAPNLWLPLAAAAFREAFFAAGACVAGPSDP